MLLANARLVAYAVLQNNTLSIKPDSFGCVAAIFVDFVEFCDEKFNKICTNYWQNMEIEHILR